MELTTIDGMLLKEMLISGAGLLDKNRQAVDALNVFPVPDGDTGTNMSQTINAAVREVNSKELFSAGEVMNAIARGALKGARGNSGVILSQIFRGFARAIEGKEKITCDLLREMFSRGAETAYKAVMKPKEGTILTVIRVISEDVEHAYHKNWDLIEMMEFVLNSGDAILRKTPDMLPVLKQAGVVDSGGKGLMVVLTGFLSAMKGEHIDNAQIESGQQSTLPGDFVDDHDFLSIEDIKFGYCTEFIVSHPVPGMTDADVNRFRARLEQIGDCVLVISDGEVVKVHVHTNDPGKAIQMGLLLGELDALKVDNMFEEARERAAKQAANKKELKEYGMVAVAMGDGLHAILSDLGVDKVVDGGQTMNPSIDDLVQAIEHTPAKVVYVFPNNSNIIMAAQQAADIITDRDVRVLTTKSVPQGIAATVAFMPDEDADSNMERMEAAAKNVSTGQITYAVRTTNFDGVEIHQGDIMGLKDGKIVCIGHDVTEIALELLENMTDDDTELITVFYGEDVNSSDANKLTDKLRDKFDMCDIELHDGGQPLYYYLFSVE